MTQLTETYNFKTREDYIRAIDKVLPDQYIQKRDIPGQPDPHLYYPIAIQEAVADQFFQEWNVADENYSVIANEIICTVKLTYTPAYPGAGERFCTGSAANPIQSDAGAKPHEFPSKKKNNALQYNLPACREMAIGNALQSLGNIFGRNLSRRINSKTKLPSNFTIRKHEQEAKDEKN